MQGFVHSPYEFPDVACYKINSPENFYVIVNVVALSIYSSPELKYLTPKQRGCRFSDESNLDISPIYTYNMCRMQCRIDQAKKLCGCVPYFYRPLGECFLLFGNQNIIIIKSCFVHNLPNLTYYTIF